MTKIQWKSLEQTFSKSINKAKVVKWLHEHIEWVKFDDNNLQPSVLHRTSLLLEYVFYFENLFFVYYFSIFFK
jgi:hypothetical protein